MIQLPPAKAYIFDMDGTLTDNMHFHHEAWMKFIALKKLGIDAATFERDYHKGTLIEVMARFFPHLTTKEELREVGNEKEALYRNTYGHLLQQSRNDPKAIEDHFLFSQYNRWRSS